MYTVYLIKRDGVPCYVGQTSQTLIERFWQHCDNKNSAMYAPIKKHGKEHFEIIPIDHAHDAKRESLNKEEFWTLFYKEQGYTLYNRNYGSRNSEQTKHKLSEALKGKFAGENNPFFGKHHTEETRKKLSEVHKGKQLSYAHRKKLSEALKGKMAGEKNPMYGKHFSDEHRKKLSEIRKGEKNHFFGKHHTEESRKKMSNSRKDKRPVQCIETGIEYISLSEAARQTNIDISSIMRVCKNKNKTAGGFHWRYVNAA